MFGVVNLYKPRGLTSHDVVAIIRKILNIKQIGHAGTLDPFAEGVLPVCIGKATRLIDYFDNDKEYIATLQFGSATDTYDLEGAVTAKSEKRLSIKELEDKLKKFKGEIEQIPPVYSAIKINGKKLYEYARNKEDVKITPRKITIYENELINFDENKQTAVIRIKCSKGTYIRSIANDIGKELGCYAHLVRLIRTKAGKFSIQNSVDLPIHFNNDDKTEYSKKYEILPDAKIHITNAIQNPTVGLSLPQMSINDDEYVKISHGNSIKKILNKFNSDDFLILVYNNNVVAVGQYNGTEVKIKKVFI